MKKLNNVLALGLVLSLLVVCACGQKGSDSATTNAEAVADVSYTPLAGGTLSVDGSGAVPIISVAQLDKDPGSYAGVVAIEGKVSERFNDRFTFIMVDCARMDGCASDCCSPATVPIRLARSEYRGELPALKDNVIVVGALTVTETGYELEVAQVRRGEDAVLEKKSS